MLLRERKRDRELIIIKNKRRLCLRLTRGFNSLKHVNILMHVTLMKRRRKNKRKINSVCNVFERRTVFLKKLKINELNVTHYQLKLHCVKSVRIWSFTGSYVPAFMLNTER